MTPNPHHRRRGLPRTEAEAQARAAQPAPAPPASNSAAPDPADSNSAPAAEAEAAVSQSSEPKPSTTAASQHSAAGAAPRRRQGLPRTEAEAAARAAEPETAAPTPAEAAQPASARPASAQQSPAAPEPQPFTAVGLPPHRPGRRRGLPRSEAEAEARKAEAQRSAPEPETPGAEASAPASTPVPTPTPARRRGLGATPVPAPAAEKSQDLLTGKPAGKVSEAAGALASGTPTPTPAEAKASAGAGAGAGAGGEVSVAPKPQRAPARTLAGRTLRQWGVLAAAGAGGVVVLAVILVLSARWFLGTSAGTSFLESYPGQYSQPDAPGGYPPWLNWAHFFNAFLMILIIKTGIQIRTEARPQAYWTPKWNKKRKISLTIWLHQALDLLWVLNGVIFVILLLTTGYWERVVPTSWDVFPNALSAGLQYASLDWPTHGEWAHYNSLQELAYFTTIFIAAPLAILTGVRMSGLWPANNQALNKAFPVEAARAVHFPVMIYFTAFILVHVILVFATGALRNLNLIYTGQDATNWTGFWLFALSLAVIIAAALATRALVVAPIASLFGRVGR